MAEEKKERTFGPQPYQFGQDTPQTSTDNAAASYDKTTMDGAPDNPENAREVVKRGVVNVANPLGKGVTAPGKVVAASGNVAGMPPLSAEEQEIKDAAAGSERKIKTLQDMIDRLDPPETAEQRKKRERREKSARIVSAVSDGLRAMSNLYFTSRYAPNMYDHEKESQLTAQQGVIDKARKDREARADEYLKFALALGDAENERAKAVSDAKAEQQRRTLAGEKAQRESEEHGWKKDLHPDRKREQKGKADKAEQDAIAARAVADNAPAMQQAKLATEGARKGSYEASAANSYASARSHDRSNLREFTAYDEKGNSYQFKSAAAAEAFARRHGTWHEDEYDEVTQTHTYSETQGVSDQTRTNKKKRGYSKKQENKGAGYGDNGKGSGYGD